MSSSPLLVPKRLTPRIKRGFQNVPAAPFRQSLRSRLHRRRHHPALTFLIRLRSTGSALLRTRTHNNAAAILWHASLDVRSVGTDYGEHRCQSATENIGLLRA